MGEVQVATVYGPSVMSNHDYRFYKLRLPVGFPGLMTTMILGSQWYLASSRFISSLGILTAQFLSSSNLYPIYMEYYM